MSGEFRDFEAVEPQNNDELLVVRDLKGKRTTIAAIAKIFAGGVPTGETPPDSGFLWFQTIDGKPAELWEARDGGVWVSAQTFEISAFTYARGNRGYTRQNPCYSPQIWFDSLAVRGQIRGVFDANEKWDFRLNLVNSARREVGFWEISLSTGDRNSVFTISESIGEAIDQSNAVSIRLRALRQGTPPNIDMLTMSAILRKVYNAPTN